MVELLDRVQGRSPFRDGLAGHERLEASDQRSQFLSRSHASLVLGRDPAVVFILRPVAVASPRPRLPVFRAERPQSWQPRLTRDDLLARLARLRQARVGQVRVPHKPLLLLGLFGQFAATGTSQASYQQAEQPVSQLNNDFGPPVASAAAARQRAATRYGTFPRKRLVQNFTSRIRSPMQARNVAPPVLLVRLELSRAPQDHQAILRRGPALPAPPQARNTAAVRDN